MSNARGRGLPSLLPTPRSLRPGSQAFRLGPKVPIVLPAAESGVDDTDFDSATALRDGVAERSGLTLPIETHARLEGLGPRIELRRSGDSGESYRLEVRKDVVRALGSGPAGLRYAVETLQQLVVPGRPGRPGRPDRPDRPGGKRIPGCIVEDAPDLEKRGILLDISRGKVPTLETLKGFIDLMVALKLNLLMLYTEHVFRFRRHPRIGRDASPMEAWEIRELDRYAARRHVELVPTLQSLGHMHHVLKIPRYRSLAESDKMWSLSPALEETYELLDDLYSEYLGNFRSPWFNANCDEPVDLGKGRSKSWAEKEGPGAVFVSHLERVAALAARYGKRTMIWADVVFEHPDVVPRLGAELHVIDWWYEANHDFDRVRVFAERGIPFLVAAGTSSWNTLFPRVTNALANIKGYADAAKRHGGRGLITTDWGDGGAYNLLGNSIYPFAFGAQSAWSSSKPESRAFDRSFSLQLFFRSSPALGRLYRTLGGLHATGFDHFNHSPLKSLYFDDLLEPKYTAKVRPRTLRATLGKLVRVRKDFRRLETDLDRRPVERDELRFAIDASILAAEKGLAGLASIHLRQAKASRKRSEGRALAKKLRSIAGTQRQLNARHEELWLRRNRRSNFEITASHYEASIRSLTRVARELDR